MSRPRNESGDVPVILDITLEHRATMDSDPGKQAASPSFMAPSWLSDEKRSTRENAMNDLGAEKEQEEDKGSVYKPRQASGPDLKSRTVSNQLASPERQLRQTRANSLYVDMPRPPPPRAWVSQASKKEEEEEEGEDEPKHQGSAGRGWPEPRLLTVKDQGEGKRQHIRIGNKNHGASGAMQDDGRLRITLDDTAHTGYLVNALSTTLSKASSIQDGHKILDNNNKNNRRPSAVPSNGGRQHSQQQRLNIVIMIIGSRGDVQPFLKIGKILKEDYGHRVRIATHPVFRDLVEKDTGLEFFSVTGNPTELMAFMVKNPNLLPSFETVMAGDVGRRRAAMAGMFDGFWRSCVDAWDGEDVSGPGEPFVADAIIANPPSIMHIHCAEALGIPVHIMFTFPYTPTQAFPHPFTSVRNAGQADGYTNFISYPLVETVVWNGLGDLVNELRVDKLKLDAVSTVWAVGATYRMHVPFTYLWSPDLVPKPKDWGSEIEIAGFVFLERASSFEPFKELAAFLAAGEAPIYVGFGSIVVDDPDRFTRMILNAVKATGVRALISKGWGGLGLENENVPDNIFMLEDTPHDWLFPQIKACIHHGGAGTTAIGLKCGKPTMIVPFFGDQHFWGKMVSNAGVGPEPIPYKELDEGQLADGIRYCLTETTQAAAAEMGSKIAEEGDGAVNAVEHFHRQLDLTASRGMQCSILRNKVAVWQVKGTQVKLSALAADILADHGLLSWKRLRPHRCVEWSDVEGPGEPLSGVASSLARSIGYAIAGIGRIPYRLAKIKNQSVAESKRKMKKLLHQGGNKGGDRTASTLTASTVSSPSKPTPEKANETAARGRASRYVSEVNQGAKSAATSLAKAPVDLAMALAQGFHNAPRLYGDDTVRRPLRVTGFHSGLRAGGLELVFGVYDGFTGIITLSIRGAKDSGVAGFAKGTSMGLMGFVLKNISAVLSPVAYTLKGIAKEAERSSSPQMTVRKTRIAQGQTEHGALSEGSRRELTKQVVDGWLTLKDLSDVVAGLKHKRHIRGQNDRALIETDAIFEDVDIAQRSLAALKRDETIRSVLRSDRQY